MTRGFTLIETIVYIALLGLLLSTGVLAAFQILQGSGELSAKAVVQDEGDFVLRKINWALSGAWDASDDTNLTIERLPGPMQVDFCVRDGQIWVWQGAAGSNIDCTDSAFKPITTSNVEVESFVYSVDDTLAPKRVRATTTIKTANGNDAPQTFTITKYLRQ